MTVGGEAVELTATEHEALRTLALDAAQVVTCETLLRQAWSGRPNATANHVRMVVNNPRRKLGDDAADTAWICNRRDVGYRFARSRPTAEARAPCCCGRPLSSGRQPRRPAADSERGKRPARRPPRNRETPRRTAPTGTLPASNEAP